MSECVFASGWRVWSFPSAPDRDQTRTRSWWRSCAELPQATTVVASHVVTRCDLTTLRYRLTQSDRLVWQQVDNKTEIITILKTNLLSVVTPIDCGYVPLPKKLINWFLMSRLKEFHSEIINVCNQVGADVVFYVVHESDVLYFEYDSLNLHKEW